MIVFIIQLSAFLFFLKLFINAIYLMGKQKRGEVTEN